MDGDDNINLLDRPGQLSVDIPVFVNMQS